MLLRVSASPGTPGQRPDRDSRGLRFLLRSPGLGAGVPFDGRGRLTLYASGSCGGAPVNPLLNPAGADLNNVANVGALTQRNIFQGILYSSNPNAINPGVHDHKLFHGRAYHVLWSEAGEIPQIFDATFSNSLFNQQRFLTVPGYTPGGGYPLVTPLHNSGTKEFSVCTGATSKPDH